MAVESQIGSLAGAGLGTAIGGPGVGTQIGAGIGGTIGGLIGSGNKNEPQVPMEDPAQVARLREIEDTKKQISEGRDPLLRSNISDIRNLGATTQGQLAKFTGGDVGGTLSSMLRAQRNTGKNVNQAFAQSQQRLPFFENLQSQLGNRIAQRKLELAINAQDTARAQAAKQGSLANAAISGTIASIGGGAGGAGGGLGGLLGGEGGGIGGGLQNLVGKIGAEGGLKGLIGKIGGGRNSIGEAELPIGDIGGMFQEGLSGGGTPGFQPLGTGFQ